jgi:hypothetical protein
MSFLYLPSAVAFHAVADGIRVYPVKTFIAVMVEKTVILHERTGTNQEIY